MQNLKISGDRQVVKNSIKLDLQVLIFEDENTWFAFMPSLDLTGYGSTEEEAKESLKIVLDEFLRYTVNKKTLISEMERLGWQIKNKNQRMHVPDISDLINSNDQLRDIINHKEYRTSLYHVNIPSFA